MLWVELAGTAGSWDSGPSTLFKVSGVLVSENCLLSICGGRAYVDNSRYDYETIMCFNITYAVNNAREISSAIFSF